MKIFKITPGAQLVLILHLDMMDVDDLCVPIRTLFWSLSILCNDHDSAVGLQIGGVLCMSAVVRIVL